MPVDDLVDLVLFALSLFSSFASFTDSSSSSFDAFRIYSVIYRGKNVIESQRRENIQTEPRTFFSVTLSFPRRLRVAWVHYLHQAMVLVLLIEGKASLRILMQ
jgi:hypothetical protein